jgi:hypothetical protein
MKRKLLRYLFGLLFILLVLWGVLTLYVEQKGPERNVDLGNVNGNRNALVVFDPDPFYNLDEQVCRAFGEGLALNNFRVKVASVTTAEKLRKDDYDLFVFCANTYNWRPDWAITSFAKEVIRLEEGKPVIAITLGAGSTESAEQALAKLVVNSGGKLLNSYTLWLWRPNNSQTSKYSNVEVAVSRAFEWGTETSQDTRINH